MTDKAKAQSEAWYASQVDKTGQTDDERIKDITVLPPPEHLIRFFPIAGTPVEKLIAQTRKNIQRIVHGQDDRLLVIIGPCSIHDPAAALAYARQLQPLREKYADSLEIVMRVYFEKPRTTVGWKGYINDPHLDGSFAINEGLEMARRLLLEIVGADPRTPVPWGVKRGANGFREEGVDPDSFVDPLGAMRARARARSEKAAPAGPRHGVAASKALTTLGLDETADAPAIRARYKELVKRLHPDANGGDRSREEKLREIIQAYKHLRTARLA